MSCCGPLRRGVIATRAAEESALASCVRPRRPDCASHLYPPLTLWRDARSRHAAPDCTPDRLALHRTAHPTD